MKSPENNCHTPKPRSAAKRLYGFPDGQISVTVLLRAALRPPVVDTIAALSAACAVEFLPVAGLPDLSIPPNSFNDNLDALAAAIVLLGSSDLAFPIGGGGLSLAGVLNTVGDDDEPESPLTLT